MSQYVLEVSFYVSTFLEINLTLGTCVNKPQYELQKSQYTKALFFTAKARPPLDIQTGFQGIMAVILRRSVP